MRRLVGPIRYTARKKGAKAQGPQRPGEDYGKLGDGPRWRAVILGLLLVVVAGGSYALSESFSQPPVKFEKVAVALSPNALACKTTETQGGVLICKISSKELATLPRDYLDQRGPVTAKEVASQGFSRVIVVALEENKKLGAYDAVTHK